MTSELCITFYLLEFMHVGYINAMRSVVFAASDPEVGER